MRLSPLCITGVLVAATAAGCSSNSGDSSANTPDALPEGGSGSSGGGGSDGATGGGSSEGGTGGGSSGGHMGGGSSGGASSEGGTDAGSGGMQSDAGQSPYVPSGYDLVFSDEFDEPQLDTNKWWTRYVYSGGTLNSLSGNGEQETYGESNNHAMTGSTMKLMAYKTGTGTYASGMVRSKTTFKYGYFESRVKMPGGLGVWPAFWLNPEDQNWPPEIDIFEFVNNGVEDTVDMLHTGVIDHGAQASSFVYTDPSFDTQWTYWKAPFNFPDTFHVIGLLWDASGATTYVDGKEIVQRGYKWVHDDGSDAGYAHVLLNLAIGGPWAGRHGVDDSAFPQGLEVDYSRVYQKAGGHDTSTSTTGQNFCPATGC